MPLTDDAQLDLVRFLYSSPGTLFTDESDVPQVLWTDPDGNVVTTRLALAYIAAHPDTWTLESLDYLEGIAVSMCGAPVRKRAVITADVAREWLATHEARV